MLPRPEKKDKKLRKRLRLLFLSYWHSGDVGREYVRRWNQSTPNAVTDAFQRVMEVNRGGVFFDLGANLGVFSRAMAPYAGRVYAFEPDPWTAARLRENVADLDNVEVVEAAIGVGEDSLTFYRSSDFDDDPEAASVKSSALLSGSANCKPGEAITVRQVDFFDFVASLEAPVPLIKMDVEGAEVALIEALLDRPDTMARLGAVFVETHEVQLPELAARTRRLRHRLAWRQNVLRRRKPYINPNWW